MSSPSRIVRTLVLACLIVAVAPPGASRAQPKALTGFPTPLVTILTPAGGKTGTTVELAVTGQNLGRPQAILLDGKPLDVTWPAAQPKYKAGAPQTITATVKLPADLAVGVHDLRIVGHWGVSNPRLFAVGDQAEAVEKEPNNDVEQANDVAVGSTVTGTISTPTDVDYFRFEGKKGQRVVLVCLASGIDSRLTPSVQLYTAAGSPLGFNRDYRGTDAVLDATLPADGAYLVRLFAYTYTVGSAEHFYRLTVSTAPWIDAVYPPMVEPGKKATLTIHGRNLPGGKLDPSATLDGRPLEVMTLDVTAPADGPATQRLRIDDLVAAQMATVDGFPVQVKGPAGASNSVLVQYATAPVVLEKAGNDKADKAQEVAVPCEIAGRIEKLRDRDWYRFAAKKGDVLSIELHGDRLGAPIDLFAAVKSADGKTTITDLDDNPDILHPVAFYSRTDDPVRFRFAVPADGPYLLLVSSREADIQAGPRSVYRVRIGPEQPDFRVVVQSPVLNSPDEPAVPAGSAAAFNLYVAPRDGFNAPLTLEADGLPPGVTLATTSLPAGVRSTTIALMAAPDAKEWAGTFTLRAKATVGGKEVVREARAGTIVWAVNPNQNIPTVSRLARDLVLAVRSAPPFKVELATTRIVLLPGESAELPVKVVALDKDFAGTVSVGPLVPIGNPGNAPLLFNGNSELNLNPGAESKPKVQTGANATPGVYTLQLRGRATLSIVVDPDSGEKGRGPIPLPAVPVQVLILPKQVVTARVADANNLPVKVGEKKDIAVQVERAAMFAGPVEVELVAPSDARGFQGMKTTLAADKTEAVVSLLAPAGTTTGQRQGFVVRLTAELEGKKFTQEVKVTVNVTK